VWVVMTTSRTGDKVRVDNHNRAKGFTLVELILVMAMMLMTLALISPSLAGFFRGRSLNDEARRFLAVVRHAQNRAISEGIPMVLWIDESTRSYGVESDITYSRTDDHSTRYSLPERIGITLDIQLPTQATSPALMPVSQADDITQVRFFPDGFLTPQHPQRIWIFEGEEGAMARPQQDASAAVLAPSPSGGSYVLLKNVHVYEPTR